MRAHGVQEPDGSHTPVTSVPTGQLNWYEGPAKQEPPPTSQQGPALAGGCTQLPVAESQTVPTAPAIPPGSSHATVDAFQSQVLVGIPGCMQHRGSGGVTHPVACDPTTSQRAAVSLMTVPPAAPPNETQ